MLKNIILDGIVENKVTGISTLYFTAPKELLKKYLTEDYPDMVSTELCIEYPATHPEPDYCSVSISPTRETECGTEDYDWTDIDIPAEDISYLLSLGGVIGKEKALKFYRSLCKTAYGNKNKNSQGIMSVTGIADLMEIPVEEAENCCNAMLRFGITEKQGGMIVI